MSEWRTNDPSCPRCGLVLHVDDPAEGYRPDGPNRPMRLKHATSTFTDRDGCIVGLGRAVAALNDRLAELDYHAGGTR